MVEKMRFSESSQYSLSEKSIFGHFEVIFLNVWIFLQVGWFFRVSTFKEEYFHGKMSCVAGLRKRVVQFSAKVLILANFDYLGPHSKSIFSTYNKSFEKSLVSFMGRVVRTIVLNFELSILAGPRGGVALLQIDIFQIRDFS